MRLDTNNKKRNNRSGFTLTEVLLVVFVFALTALIYGATFPIAKSSGIKAANTTLAISLAEQQIEQLRSAGYMNVLVGDPITETASELTGGVKTITITQYSAKVKKIQVDISWTGYRKTGGSVTLVTMMSDHS